MKYFQKDLLLALCQDIDIPQEISCEIASFAETFDITPVAHFVEDLCLADKAEKANDAINAHLNVLGGDPRGIGILTMHLTAALKSRALYAQKGISDQIFIDTMKCFSRFIGEHRVQFDHYGFNRSFWTWRQPALLIFRLGTLEFEIKVLDSKNVLSVHIPSNAVMTREGLDASYQWAKKFFAEYYHDFDYEHMYCGTWLLAPMLKELLPEGSKILNFMDDYEIFKTNPDSQGFMRWVYKKTYPDLSSLPEDTSLQRTIKQHLLAGGKIGDASGYYIHR